MANKNESKMCDFSLTLCLHCCGDGDGVGIIFTNITAYTEHFFLLKKERFKYFQIAQNSRQPQKKIQSQQLCFAYFFIVSRNKVSDSKKMTEKNGLDPLATASWKITFSAFVKRDAKWDTKDYFQIIQSTFFFCLDIRCPQFFFEFFFTIDPIQTIHTQKYPVV